jgi:indolepyruvate ferredoxin oxidoreductase beta subunit
MAQRGGMVTNQLIIGEAQSPIIDAGEADIVAGFEPIETLRSLHYGREGCIVFMNRSRVVPYSMTMQGKSYPNLAFFLDQMKARASTVVAVDAARLAGEAGNPRALGMVMLGLMAGTGVFPFSAGELRAVLEAFSPAGRAEVNLRAFDAGMKISPQLQITFR